MRDFSVIDMIIKTKQMLLFFLAVTSCKGTFLFWKRGWGEADHLHLKRHALIQRVSASTQNRHFQNYIINDLWGILSWNFSDTFWGHILGTQTYITYCKKGHNRCPLNNPVIVFNVDNNEIDNNNNVSWANHQIRTISEGSQDTEVWSNGCL